MEKFTKALVFAIKFTGTFVLVSSVFLGVSSGLTGFFVTASFIKATQVVFFISFIAGALVLRK